MQYVYGRFVKNGVLGWRCEGAYRVGDQANNEHNCDIELLISDGKRVDCVWCVLVLDSMAY